MSGRTALPDLLTAGHERHCQRLALRLWLGVAVHDSDERRRSEECGLVANKIDLYEGKMLIDKLLDDVIKSEGGFVNHSADHGGATKYGITQGVLSEWRGRMVSVVDVSCLRPDEAKDIYRRNYYFDPKINLLPELVQPIVFDMAVNMGCKAAIKLAQQVFNKMGTPILSDGSIGGKTIMSAKAACNVYGQEVVNAIVNARVHFYQGLAEKDPRQKVFLAGWLKRANSFYG